MFQKQAFDCLSRGKTESLGTSLLDYRLAKRVIKAYCDVGPSLCLFSWNQQAFCFRKKKSLLSAWSWWFGLLRYHCFFCYQRSHNLLSSKVRIRSFFINLFSLFCTEEFCTWIRFLLIKRHLNFLIMFCILQLTTGKWMASRQRAQTQSVVLAEATFYKLFCRFDGSKHFSGCHSNLPSGYARASFYSVKRALRQLLLSYLSVVSAKDSGLEIEYSFKTYTNGNKQSLFSWLFVPPHYTGKK